MIKQCRSILLISSIFLVACQNKEEPMIDAVSYVKNMKNSSIANNLTPIKKIPVYQFNYARFLSLNDPFMTANQRISLHKSKNTQDFDKLKIAHQNREKTLTEKFPIENYHFLGIINQRNEKWMIVKSVASEKIFKLKVGDFLGVEGAEIISIYNNKVTMKQPFFSTQNKKEYKIIEMKQKDTI